MGYLAMDCWCRTKLTNLPSSPYLHLGLELELGIRTLQPLRRIPVLDTLQLFESGRNYDRFYLQNALPVKLLTGFRANTRVYASKISSKKSKKAKETPKIVNPQLGESSSDEQNEISNKLPPTDFINELESRDSVAVASRSSVLQACTLTSGFIALLGVIIRQGTHLASSQGWHVVDCSSEISFDFEIWDLQLIAGLVILISSSRFLLLKTWSDFAQSSDNSNQQVLTSLEPLDYAIVAFLPGISEELLFRGALLPIFGINLSSATAVAALFGILHLGSGRKFSFAIWATFVGLAYGYATILSSSLFVPMASHAINNLIGGVIWRVTHFNNQSKQGLTGDG